MNRKEFKQIWMREKELRENEIMYGQFVREIPETIYQKKYGTG